VNAAQLALETALSARAASLWVLQPDRLQALQTRFHTINLDLDTIDSMKAKFAASSTKKQTAKRAGRCVLITVSGTLVHRTDWLSAYLGEVGCEDIAYMMDEACSDDSTDAIVFDVHSPGGSVYGVMELAAKIATCDKKTIASINSLAASGAYWLSSQCRECTITPSGECGSIGVYLLSVCQKRMLDDMGISVSIIRAGKSKISNNPFEELTSEARAELQRRVDDTYDSFIRDVAAGRGTTLTAVRDGFGQGEIYGAKLARSLDMVDSITTLSEIIGRYGSLSIARDPSASSSSAIVSSDPGTEIRRRKLMLDRDRLRSTRSSMIHSQDQRLGALHEAGHVFAAVHFGAVIEKVSMYPNGHTIFHPTGEPLIDAAIIYAGAEAGDGGLSDSDRNSLSQLCPDPDLRAKGLYLAKQLVRDNSKSIQALAEKLLEKGSIGGNTVRVIIAAI
jgi:capsid assembly protease